MCQFLDQVCITNKFSLYHIVICCLFVFVLFSTSSNHSRNNTCFYFTHSQCTSPICINQTKIYETATGFARSIPAGQSLRQQPQYPTTITSSNVANDAGHSHVITSKVRAKLLSNESRRKVLFCQEIIQWFFLVLQPTAATIESPPVTPPVVSVPSGSSVAAIAASINTQISSTPFVSIPFI